MSGFNLLGGSNSNVFSSVQILEINVPVDTLTLDVNINTVDVNKSFVIPYVRASASTLAVNEFRTLIINENNVRVTRESATQQANIVLYVYEINNGSVQTLEFQAGSATTASLNVNNVEENRAFYIISFSTNSTTANISNRQFTPVLINPTTLEIRHASVSVTRNCVVQIIQF